MATTAQAKGKPTPRRLKAAGPKESLYQWEGRDKMGKKVRGEMRAGGEAVVQATLRRQGIQQVKVKKQKMSGGRKVTDKDISLFTRQLATMMRSGVPLLQAFGRSSMAQDSGNSPPWSAGAVHVVVQSP